MSGADTRASPSWCLQEPRKLSFLLSHCPLCKRMKAVLAPFCRRRSMFGAGAAVLWVCAWPAPVSRGPSVRPAPWSPADSLQRSTCVALVL